MPVTAFQVDIVKAVREAFDQLRFQYDGAHRVWVPWQEDPFEGQSGWTLAIKTALCMVGQENFGFSAGCHGLPVATYGEWLYDVTWCDEDDEGRMDGLPLAAECEWTVSSTAIVEDFQKLLVARAGVRLMIHENWRPRDEIPDLPAMANHLAQHVRAFRGTQRDDVYLLAALQWDSDTDAEYRFRYFGLNTDGTAIEWVEKEPCPLVANAPWVVFPEDLEC